MPNIDPILTLALSMQRSKGIYALVLGSGISTSSGIPTGWGIIQDLIHKLALLKNESCEPDPCLWYKSVTGRESNYSDILDQITSSSAERSLLLRAYFEPNGQEKQEGLKLPTIAHRAIAKLVANGYFRVIVTTNFDRLIEQALSDEGIQASVISTEDAIQGAIPIVHSPCTIIKVNGDYLDSRLKNTERELSEYPQPLNKLLDSIFDSYGIIVCGWSGDWDAALRLALERCRPPFATYWICWGRRGEHAERLIGLKKASPIEADADSFFGDLAEKLQAIEDYSIVDPVTAQVAVARVKRYLSKEEYRINFHDLFNVETEKVHKDLGSIEMTTLRDALRLCIPEYQSKLHILLPMAICGAYWADTKQAEILIKSLKRIADGPFPNDLGWNLNLRRYPALVLLYAMGLAAISRSNYEFLHELFSITISTGNGPDKPVTQVLNSRRVISPDDQRQLPGYKNRIMALSDHLFHFLREPLREYVPNDEVYDRNFDWFEYFLGLIHCDRITTTQQLEEMKTSPNVLEITGPLGRYLSKDESDGPGVQTRMETKSGQYPKEIQAAFSAGFFKSIGYSGSQHFRDIKTGFDTYIAKKKADHW